MTSHQEAKRRADEHLREQGVRLRASGASRSARYGVWVVAYRDPAEPDAALDGGALVVTDEGGVHDMGSVPGALDDLMMALGRWPGAEPADVLGPPADGATVTDLAAWAESRR
ncbi:hypothetical protein [Nocardioides aquaticus]|uniref:hypothetical protein n=1 Tax=Nocardioides aquaticus TaxID=160826 RepID=UPI001BD681FF|nr:hypothetical protein [Nocardioides aquaticus]